MDKLHYVTLGITYYIVNIPRSICISVYRTIYVHYIVQHMAEQLKNNGLESFDETQETDRSCSTDTLTSTSKSDTNSDSGQKSDATDAGGVANKQDKTKSLSASRLRHHSGGRRMSYEIAQDSGGTLLKH